jgi:hypothetical protein
MICSSLKRLLRARLLLSGPERAILHGEVTFPLDYFSGGRSLERNEHFLKHPRRAGNKMWGDELVPSKFLEKGKTANMKNGAKSGKWPMVEDLKIHIVEPVRSRPTPQPTPVGPGAPTHKLNTKVVGKMGRARAKTQWQAPAPAPPPFPFTR